MADEHRDRRSKRPSAAVLLDRVKQLTEQAVKHQQYDGASWENLVDELRGIHASSEARACYDAVLELMPSASVVWSRYVDMELGPGGNMEAAKQLFGRCLLACPRVELYLLYLKFIKRMNEGRGALGAEELRSSYEFSLDVVGQDLGAGPLWSEYLQFLQAPKPGTDAFAMLYPGTLEGQEEAARTPVVRRAFQRAVLVPCNQLEALWRNYETWETKVDKQLAKKVLDEWRPRFQAAKNVLRDRKRRMERIVGDALPLPPGQGGAFQAAQVQLWRQYLDFESSNPQGLEPDSPAFKSRISLAFGQCLTVLWFYPEMWYQYACSQLANGGAEAAVAVLARGQGALPSCSLLRFMHAELRESNGQIEEAKQVYDQMIDSLEQEVPSSPDPATPDQPASPGQLSPLGGEQGALVWLQYVRFLRRTTDTGTARQAFLRARRWQQKSISLAPLEHPAEDDKESKESKESQEPQQPRAAGGQLYTGMARLEWSLDRTNPDIACRIFELGLEDPRLARDPAYIQSYASFLIEAGDVDNARALFERCLSEREVSSSVELWRAYAVVEAQQGNLTAALQVEERMRAALAAAAEPGALPPGAPLPLEPSVAALQVALCKYSSEGMLPCEQAQALHMRRSAALAPPPAAGPPPEEAGPRDPLANGHPRGPPPLDRGPGPRGWDRDHEAGAEPRGRDRDRDRGRDRDRDRDRHRDASQEDLGRGPRGGWDEEGPGGGPPDMIEMLISQLPPPMAVEGPLVPVEAVMDVAFHCNMSAACMATVCAELDAGHMPTGEGGVEVPQILPRPHPRRPYPEDMPPGPGGFHSGPPPYGHDPHDPYAYGHEPYGMPPPHGPPHGPPPHGGGPPHGGPPPGPMTRKRRWDGPDGRGPPPPYDGPGGYDEGPGYDSWAGGPGGGPPPPHHWYPDDRRGPPPRGRMDS